MKKRSTYIPLTDVPKLQHEELLLTILLQQLKSNPKNIVIHLYDKRYIR